jgi:magnesium chelatase subunit D
MGTGSAPPAGPAPVLPGAEQPDQEDAVAGPGATADEPAEPAPSDLHQPEDEDPLAAGTGEGDDDAGTGGHAGAPSPGASGSEGGDDAGDTGHAAHDPDVQDAPAPGDEDGAGEHDDADTSDRAGQHDDADTSDRAGEHDDGDSDRVGEHDDGTTGDRAGEHDDGGAASAPAPGAPTTPPDGTAPVGGAVDGRGEPGQAPASPPGGPWQSLSGGTFNAPPASLGEAPPPSFDPGPPPHDRLDAPVRTAEPAGFGEARTATEVAPAGTVLADAAGRAAAQWRQDGVDVAAAATTAEASAPTSGSTRSRAVGRTVVVAVDASGSSGTHKRVEAATGAVLGLLGDAYLRRDRVAMVTFRGDTADVVLPPTASLEMARARLAELPTGGVTPLAEGINAGLALARRAESDGWPPLLVLVTDGRATGNQSAPERAGAAAAEVAAAQVEALVIDARAGSNGAGGADQLAEAMGARCLRLEDLTPAAVEAAVRDALR